MAINPTIQVNPNVTSINKAPSFQDTQVQQAENKLGGKFRSLVVGGMAALAVTGGFARVEKVKEANQSGANLPNMIESAEPTPQGSTEQVNETLVAQPGDTPSGLAEQYMHDNHMAVAEISPADAAKHLNPQVNPNAGTVQDPHDGVVNVGEAYVPDNQLKAMATEANRQYEVQSEASQANDTASQAAAQSPAAEQPVLDPNAPLHVG